MRILRLISAAICVIVVAATADYQLIRGNNVSRRDSTSLRVDAASKSKANALVPATLHYQLDASQSKFAAHALAGGLLWFKGHNHLIAVREFTGEAQLTPSSMAPASLTIIAKTASMVETSSVFTEPQKQIINKELREIVLLPDQYPEIVFKSTNVTGTLTGSNQYDVKIMGDLTLHGVTRPITIPTKV